MEDHAHVLTICRHCGNPSNKFVGATMEDARENLRGLPAFFRADDKLRYADIQIIDQDLIRIKINKHDLLVFTSQCGGEYAACLEEYEQAVMMANMAKNLEKAFQNMFGEDFNPEKFFREALEGIPQTQQEPKNNRPTQDRSQNILNQIDLPEDFLGHRP